MFESDFASTEDEDENRMDEVEGEKEVQQEERAARKVSITMSPVLQGLT